MTNLDEVQPVDSHVEDLLKKAKRFRLRIDPQSATRDERLTAALAYHEDRDVRSALEIMYGKRISGSDKEAREIGVLQLKIAINPNLDLREFYSGIEHSYRP